MPNAIFTAKKIFSILLIIFLVMALYCGDDGGGDEDETDAAGDPAAATVVPGGDTSPPTPGNNGVITVSGRDCNYINVNWSSAGDETSPASALTYAVYRSTLSNMNTVAEVEANGTLIKDYTANISSYTATSLESGTSYYINVLVKDSAGNKGVYTAATAATMKFQWGFNGEVKTITVSGDTVYIGGSFSGITLSAPRGQILDTTSGGIASGIKPIDISGSYVNVAVPDGSGGWYIGGMFNNIYNQPRNNIARINSDGSLSEWAPSVNGEVYAIAVSGSTVYIGGTFTTVNSSLRSYIAAIDANTGAVTDWDPYANGFVRAIAVDGSTVYAGGDFGVIGGYTRGKIAALDVNGIAFGADYNCTGGNVYAIAVTPTTVILGGNFSCQTKSYLVEINKSNGVITGWSPNPNNLVSSLKIYGSDVLVAGSFTFIGGGAYNFLKSLNNTTGTATATISKNVNMQVNSMDVIGDTVYFAGDFTTVDGQTRNRLAALNLTNQALAVWNPDANSSVKTVAVSSGKVFVGGNFSTVGGIVRNKGAAFSVSTGALKEWNPNANGDISAIAVAGSSIIIGGTFTNVGAAARTNLAAVDPLTGVANPWVQNADGPVYTISADSSYFYIGGSFTTINASGRNSIARFIPSGGTLDAWNPGVSGTVNQIRVAGNNVYVGGAFFKTDGVTWNNAAIISALDATYNAAWYPNVNSTVNSILPVSGYTFIGGVFTNVSGYGYNYLSVIQSNGVPASWNLGIAGMFVKDMAISGTDIIVAGNFFSPRNNILKANMNNGYISQWSPAVDGPVNAVSLAGDIVFIGGSYSTVNGKPRAGFSAVDITSGELK